jgi:hypothetical protein
MIIKYHARFGGGGGGERQEYCKPDLQYGNNNKEIQTFENAFFHLLSFQERGICF